MSLGMPEIIVILVIALLLFGPSRLPGLGKSMGEAIRGFKKGMDGSSDKDVTDSMEKSERNREKIESHPEDSSASSKAKVKTEEPS